MAGRRRRRGRARRSRNWHRSPDIGRAPASIAAGVSKWFPHPVGARDGSRRSSARSLARPERQDLRRAAPLRRGARGRLGSLPTQSSDPSWQRWVPPSEQQERRAKWWFSCRSAGAASHRAGVVPRFRFGTNCERPSRWPAHARSGRRGGATGCADRAPASRDEEEQANRVLVALQGRAAGKESSMG